MFVHAPPPVTSKKLLQSLSILIRGVSAIAL
jgi:hypothetical protein